MVKRPRLLIIWSAALHPFVPTNLLVGSASEDYGADPQSEFLTTLHASAAWELLGKPGLVTPNKLPEANDVLHEGFIGYHLRPGKHFLSREDWNYYIKFLKEKLSQQLKK